MFQHASKWLLISCLLFSACTNDGGSGVSIQSAPATSLDIDFLESITAGQQSIRSYASNKTLIFYGPSHGAQIEYYSPSGDLFLWYPGNTRIVEGQWKTQSNKQICYLYPISSRNPVTGQLGGSWECTHAAAVFAFDYERLSGNPFDLKPGSVGFILEKRQFYTASEIGTRLGTGDNLLESLRTARN